MDPIFEELVINRGVDWYWARAVAHDDGTLKNLEGWTGAFNVYATAYTDTPLVSSATNATLSLGLQGMELASTTLDGPHSAGTDSITVASVTGISVGDTITVIQNEVAILEATVTTVSGTTVTLSAALTDATATGAVVQAWDSRYMLANVLLHIDDNVTGALAPFTRGKFDLDLTDPFNHEDRYWQGTACLQEGTA